ncbi:MAG TPA: hypothetical protein DIW26_06640 [Ruminococcus sp.]|nr:hypothetical protein [Ruminococcus sp.]HCR74048.1 hypothetical protein [Ruminococcus sp.]
MICRFTAETGISYTIKYFLRRMDIKLKITREIIIAEIIVLVCTIGVFIYAYFNKSQALNLLYIYNTAVLMIVIAMGAYIPVRMKKEIEVNKYQISNMINVINACVVIWREDCSAVILNDYAKKMLKTENMNAPEIIEMLFPTSVFGKQRAENMLSNSGREVRIRLSDSTEYVYSWNTSLLISGKNNKFFISIGLDLTDIKKAENELKKSQSKYLISMELSEIGIMLDADGSLYVSDQLRKMLGIKEAKPSYDDIRHRVHTNDKMIFDTYVKGKSSDSGRTHSAEMRIRSCDGSYHWYLYRYRNMIKYDSRHQFSGGAFMDITKDKEKDLRIERLAYIDEITEIYNRNKLMLTGQETYECCRSLNYSYWVIVLDIDKFHIINDTCGYSNGNRLLRDFAHVMYKYISLGGFGARIGGDNFALVIRNYSDEYSNDDSPRKTIEKIQNDIACLATDIFSSQSISCSAGYSQMPADGADFAEILDHAEFALSSGKDHRNSIVAYNSRIHDSIIDITSTERAIADAIVNNEFELHYQPKINLSDGKVMGAEALIRWRKSDGTIVPPGKFVPIAEASKLITQIGDYVMLEACRQNKLWQDMGYDPIIISINLTSVDFYQKDVKEAVTDTLAKTGLDSQWLEIELTESLALKDIDMAIKQMEALRSMGIRLAMDDFGTGYSSLSYIQILPITLLKLDRSFIINLENDVVAREIVSAVIKIAKSKKIETIAEGIETIGQARILYEEGCDYAQGFFYGKPMPPDEFGRFLEKNKTERKLL